MVSILYNIFFVPLGKLAVFFLKFFSTKLKEREEQWYDILKDFCKTEVNNNVPRFWFHASSMGEFEQAKPLIELLKKQLSNCCIIVSFYSPSGYLNQKYYQFADYVLYMPFDSGKNAKLFISLIKPDIAVFVRYDIWRNHLIQLHNRNVPSFLICATEPAGKLMKSSVLKYFAKSNYNLFSRIFTVGEQHTKYFLSLNLKSKVETLSDTRFDRIIENVENAKNNKILPDEFFCNDEIILVAGSTWQPDEIIITDAIRKTEKVKCFKIRLLLVPHEPTKEHLIKSKKLLPNSFYLSEVLQFLETKSDTDSYKDFLGRNHIIVDSIGKLLQLYANAHLAYIGGAFGAGVHSVTEPAGYGIPLATGTKYHNSPDAIELQKLNALSVIKNKEDMFDWIKENSLSKEKRGITGLVSRNYVYDACGSSEKIVNYIVKSFRQKTNYLES